MNYNRLSIYCMLCIIICFNIITFVSILFVVNRKLTNLPVHYEKIKSKKIDNPGSTIDVNCVLIFIASTKKL